MKIFRGFWEWNEKTFNVNTFEVIERCSKYKKKDFFFLRSLGHWERATNKSLSAVRIIMHNFCVFRKHLNKNCCLLFAFNLYLTKILLTLVKVQRKSWNGLLCGVETLWILVKLVHFDYSFTLILWAKFSVNFLKIINSMRFLFGVRL
jgi:hypothetical protein